MDDRINGEMRRLKTVDGYKESLADLEMDSRSLRKRRLPYLENLNKHAREKAKDLAAAATLVDFNAQDVNDLVELLTQELVRECRDGL